jgi:hypothetical protein
MGQAMGKRVTFSIVSLMRSMRYDVQLHIIESRDSGSGARRKIIPILSLRTIPE